MGIQPRPGSAGLPLIEEYPRCNGCRCRIEIRIRQNDLRRLSPKLETDLLSANNRLAH